jgi:O-antigen/teichoic acid export membrane protein
MTSLARQAMVVTASRLLNQGLMVLSPLVLVRLLTVEDFGAYREFLLYATVLGNLAAFSLPNSLLYFIGRQPAGAVGYARRVAFGLGVASVLTVLLYGLIEALLPRPPLGEHLLPCLLYVLCFANLDFWEFLWLAQRRASRVMLYTAGRLAARTLLVCVVAWLTSSVAAMLWSLVALEALRLLVAAVAWRRIVAGAAVVPLEASWREQLAFSLPSGLVVFVSTFNRSVGGMVVGQAVGEAALALLVIGGYLLGILAPLRNSISDVLLPTLSAQAKQGSHAWVPAWQRSSVQVAILLFPVAVVSWRYAGPFVSVAFSERYAEAAPLLRWYAGMVALACLDVALALRVMGRTRSMLGVSVVTLAVNLGLLALLLPRYGVEAAAAALLLSTASGTLYLLWQATRALQVPVAAFVPLGALAKVAFAALAAALVMAPAFWFERFGLAGALVASALYVGAFVAVLHGLRLPEARDLQRRVLERFATPRLPMS